MRAHLHTVTDLGESNAVAGTGPHTVSRLSPCSVIAAPDHSVPNDARSLSSPVPCVGPAASTGTVPRVLSFVVIKRIDPRLPSTWGHWWVEVDGRESYGWWPLPCPLGLRRVITGSRGTLNALGTATEGTATRDPYHGDEPDHSFHPTLVVAKSDDQVRADIRAFAHGYVGGFRWPWWWLRKPAESCRTFQWGLFKAVGLVEEEEYLYTQGPGCPFMYPFRSVKWRVQDIFAAAAARVRPGRLESPPPEAR